MQEIIEASSKCVKTSKPMSIIANHPEIIVLCGHQFMLFPVHSFANASSKSLNDACKTTSCVNPVLPMKKVPRCYTTAVAGEKTLFSIGFAGKAESETIPAK